MRSRESGLMATTSQQWPHLQDSSWDPLRREEPRVRDRWSEQSGTGGENYFCCHPSPVPTCLNLWTSIPVSLGQKHAIGQFENNAALTSHFKENLQFQTNQLSLTNEFSHTV